MAESAFAAAQEEVKIDALGRQMFPGRPPLQPAMGSGTDLAKHMEHQAHL